MVHLGLFQWTNMTKPRWENGRVEGFPTIAPIYTALTQKIVFLLKFEWLEGALLLPKKLCSFNPRILGLNPKKPMKDFGWFRILKFDPLGAQLQLQLQNSACWKLPINPPGNGPKLLGWPLLSNPCLPKWAFGVQLLLPSSTKTAGSGLCTVPKPNNLNCWNDGSTSCKTKKEC